MRNNLNMLLPSARSVVAAIGVFAFTGTIGIAIAQPPGSQQGQPGGTMMGPSMMGPNGMMGNGGYGPGMMGWGGQGAAMCTMMTSHIDGRLAYLKTELKITDAQEPLWNAYAGAARDNAKSMTAHCTSIMGQNGAATLSLPDRIDRHEQFMAAQLESLRAMDKTLKPLYAAFSDTQKKLADSVMIGPMGMM